MPTEIVFTPFLLDLVNEQLRRGTEIVQLRPKPFAVLRYLIEHRGQPFTAEQLCAFVWSGTKVNPGVVKVHIKEIRKALKDDANNPRFIETVPRRGYQFIGETTQSNRNTTKQATPSVSLTSDSTVEHATLKAILQQAQGELLRQEIELARQGGETAEELRATMSLARLWQEQGKKAEAYRLVSDFCHRHSAGPGAPDLTDVRALLKELA